MLTNLCYDFRTVELPQMGTPMRTDEPTFNDNGATLEEVFGPESVTSHISRASNVYMDFLGTVGLTFLFLFALSFFVVQFLLSLWVGAGVWTIVELGSELEYLFRQFGFG